MFGELKPCGAKLADGVVCESVVAYRKLRLPKTPLTRADRPTDPPTDPPPSAPCSASAARRHGRGGARAAAASAHWHRRLDAAVHEEAHRALHHGRVHRRPRGQRPRQALHDDGERAGPAGQVWIAQLVHPALPRRLLPLVRRLVRAGPRRVFQLPRPELRGRNVCGLFAVRVSPRDARLHHAAHQRHVHTWRSFSSADAFCAVAAAAAAARAAAARAGLRQAAPRGGRAALRPQLRAGHLPAVPRRGARDWDKTRALNRDRGLDRALRVGHRHQELLHRMFAWCNGKNAPPNPCPGPVTHAHATSPYPALAVGRTGHLLLPDERAARAARRL